MTEYVTREFQQFSDEQLREAGRDIQLDVMETWFRKRYEDPAERTPYESAEGGYIWIWGGPYDAGEELREEFSGLVPDEVIDELTEELQRECWQWAPTPSRQDYDDYLVDDIAKITEYYHNFAGAILDIEKLLRTNVDSSVATCFYRMLFVNVVTALETYLSDAFINTVANNPALMRRFIETTPEFQGEKVALSEVFKAVEEIERKARSYLVDVVWHHLQRVRPMYKDTLAVDFPPDIGAIFRAVLKRHDIVHRNGRTKDGEELLISAADVAELIQAVETMVQQIDSQLAEVRKKYSNPGAATGEEDAF